MQNLLRALGYLRCQEREPVSGAGRLTWDDSRLGARVAPAMVRNISDGGLQIVCREPLPVGVTAFLTGEHFEVLGRVRYCVLSDDGFRVGLQFTREPYFRNSVAGPI